MSHFRWSKKAETAAITLANGHTQEETGDIAGVNRRTIQRWLNNPEFAEEVDRLTFLTGIANKAERLRQAKRVVRSLGISTEKDLLDWLKYVQGETDGVKLDLTELFAALYENDPPVAGSGPSRTAPLSPRGKAGQERQR